jgi:DNA-binding transcriptional ArsR family regulator
VSEKLAPARVQAAMVRGIVSGIPEALRLAEIARSAYVSIMSEAQPAVAEIAALVGNPARANILMALIEGRALTATELSYVAGVSPQTTSEHLAMLREANLLSMAKQGRHSYFRLGSPQVAHMLESIMVVAADAPQRYRPRWNGGEQLRTARTCYDHIAGRLGVALTDAMNRQEHIVLSEDGGVITRAGEKFLTDFGVLLEDAKRGRRTFCRPCIDWSERRLHLAGALGAALAERCLELGWVARVRGSRALKISAEGHSGFRELFGFTLPDEEIAPLRRAG